MQLLRKCDHQQWNEHSCFCMQVNGHRIFFYCNTEIFLYVATLVEPDVQRL